MNMLDTATEQHAGLTLLIPQWPVPANVHACCTTRQGGTSRDGYAELNLATHVGDDAANVQSNRQKLQQAILEISGTKQSPVWLQQVHGAEVIELPASESVRADASFTRMSQQICTVMTADCLPVLITDHAGQWVAAVHAGWRGLVAGVLSNTIKHYGTDVSQLMIWLGPAISAANYEVDNRVYQAFMEKSDVYGEAFRATRKHHYQLDVYEAARQECLLNGISIQQIYGGGGCTLDQSGLFYSHRRDGTATGAGTGRMASMIWMT